MKKEELFAMQENYYKVKEENKNEIIFTIKYVSAYILFLLVFSIGIPGILILFGKNMSEISEIMIPIYLGIVVVISVYMSISFRVGVTIFQVQLFRAAFTNKPLNDRNAFHDFLGFLTLHRIFTFLLIYGFINLIYYIKVYGY